MIKIFFAGVLSDEQAVIMLDELIRMLHELAASRAHTGEKSAQLQLGGHEPRQVFYWLLTLEYSVAQVQTALAWAESARQRILNQDYTNHFPTFDDPH